MNNRPPKWPLRFFRWFCHPDYAEDIEGDLLERFEKRIEEKKPARLLLALDILMLFRPGLIRGWSTTQRFIHYGMFRNFIITTLRSFKREKGVTLSNILGLGFGMASCLFIYLWIADELAYNSNLESGDRVSRILTHETQMSGTIHTSSLAPYRLLSILEEEYPIVEQAAILSNGNWMAFEVEEEKIEWAGVDASPAVFDLFEINFLKGGPNDLSDNLNAIAISESMAETYFGENWQHQDVVGTLMPSDEGEVFQLAGVYENISKWSTVQFDFVIPFDNLLKKRPHLNNWDQSSSRLFVKLKDDISISSANGLLKNAIHDHQDSEPVSTSEIALQPFEDIYLYNRFENGAISGGRIDYVRLLAITAILILLLASINFINLTTAQATKRVKETSVRKVLGSTIGQLRAQFLIESLTITCLSILFASILLVILFPNFEQLTGKEYNFKFSLNQAVFLFGFILIQGITSGLYPAFFLSSSQTISHLKSGKSLPKNQIGFRRSLVVFQFVITLLMIIGSVTIYQQVNYIRTKNIGLDRSNLIRTFSYDMKPDTEYQAYKTELLAQPGIESVTLVDQLLINMSKQTTRVDWQGKSATDEIAFYHMDVNPDFIPTMKIAIHEGRNFDWKIQSDTSNYIINETAQHLMEITDPIGKDLTMWGIKGKIIGVVEDFHNASLHSAIKPMIIRNKMKYSWMVLIRTKPEMHQEALASIEKIFLAYNPDRTFWYRFLDDMYESHYKSELLIEKLSWYFTIISIIISLLGLISLITYSAERRTKEVGIRKVLGASIRDIFKLLSVEYIVQLGLAVVLAYPISYIIMSNWLSGFVYGVSLDWSLYVFAATASLLMIFLITILKTSKIALSNPTESLKDE